LLAIAAHLQYRPRLLDDAAQPDLASWFDRSASENASALDAIRHSGKNSNLAESCRGMAHAIRWLGSM
jgi:hypothetical protein